MPCTELAKGTKSTEFLPGLLLRHDGLRIYQRDIADMGSDGRRTAL